MGDSSGLRAERLLARAGFGPRPGDAEALRAEGAEAWLAAQLAAGDDPDLDRRLAPFESLRVDARDIANALHDEFDIPRMRADDADREDRVPDGVKRAIGGHRRTILRDLAGARVVRAVHGRFGLREAMIDFWSNHFSIFGAKSWVATLLPAFVRDVIEPHALGRFEDMLIASAKSPAMLVYLDNWRSTAPRRRRFGRQRGGLNENYARELLELHTLGVDAGYTQEDVVEVARVFTGWSLAGRRDPRFGFHDRLHDGGGKRVLGEPVPGEGIEQGLALLGRLARHPATAVHLSRKLAARFVHDDPPAALVDRAARRYLETEGDIGAVLQVVLGSPELAAPGNRKFKSPLRFVASAIRLGDGTTDGGRPMLGALDRLGELPYLARTPAGHPEAMSQWLDPAAMLDRMAFAFALGEGALRGTQATPARRSSRRERERLALRIASPEFQWA